MAQEDAGTQPGANQDADPDPLLEWRQGDFTLDLTSNPQIGLNTKGERVVHFRRMIGAAAVSQTCDIVNRGGHKDSIVFSPLVKVDASLLRQVTSQRTPAFAELEHPPEQDVVVDLGRMFTIEKSVVASFQRFDGLSSEEARRRFAFALERKHGRFAFPDDFNLAFAKWRDRIIGAHGKQASPVGELYRSILEMRVIAAPHWDAADVSVSLFVILKDDLTPEVIKRLRQEIAAQVGGVVLPDRFDWSDPPFEMDVLDGFSARIVHDGQHLDLAYLSVRDG